MSSVTVEVSFYGPFVFVMGPETVRIYAPRCAGHLASVQTDVDEKALTGCGPDKQYPSEYVLRNKVDGRFSYGLSSAKSMDCGNPEKVILVESWRKLEEPELADCHFQLEVARPDCFVGLITDLISIVEYDLPVPGKGEFVQKATAMRFYYRDLDPSTKLQVVRTEGNEPGPITEIDLNPIPPQQHVPITFRYSSNSIFDQNHQDAEECFTNMRALFPAIGAWKVNFDVPLPVSPGHPGLLRMGGDCKAAHIMFVSFDDKERWLPGSAVKQPSSLSKTE
jgi:hypothetical protein